MSDFETEPLSASDVESDFSCGQPQLDDYFKRHALSNDWRGIGKTFVLHAKETDPKDLPHVLGFYSLFMAELATKLPSRLPRALRKGLPKYPLPVALIGRLAVDHRAQRHGLGERLLGDALARVHAAATLLGCYWSDRGCKGPGGGGVLRDQVRLRPARPRWLRPPTAVSPDGHPCRRGVKVDAWAQRV